MTHFHAFARSVLRDPGWPACCQAYADQLLPRWMQSYLIVNQFYHLVLGSAIQKKYQKLLARVFSLIKKMTKISKISCAVIAHLPCNGLHFSKHKPISWGQKLEEYLSSPPKMKPRKNKYN